MAKVQDNLTLCLPRTISSNKLSNKPCVVRTKKPTELPHNHVLIAVERFGFSANNITYQALGEAPHFRYFDFHPAPRADNVSPETHGLIPVWGFGTVIDSTHARIHIGERVYGYFAPTRYLLVPVSPSDVNKHAFYVPRPHFPADRRPYNRILRCANDPQYDPSPEVEDLTMLYRPLFWTSYWCEDWLHSSAYRNGARRVLISSASSKTAFCLAYAIRKRGIAGMRVVGLTSKKNLAFTRSLGLYDAVADYGSSFSSVPALSALPGDKWIYVDVAGQDALNARVFAHLGDPLVARIALGMTALSPAAPPGSLSTDWSGSTFSSPPQDAGKMEPFFMVEWLHVRRRQISPTDMFAMQNQAWRDLMRDCRNWVKMERVYGPDAVGEAYEHAVKRGIGPEKGYIWSLWEEDDRPTVKSRL